LPRWRPGLPLSHSNQVAETLQYHNAGLPERQLRQARCGGAGEAVSGPPQCAAQLLKACKLLEISRFVQWGSQEAPCRLARPCQQAPQPCPSPVLANPFLQPARRSSVVVRAAGWDPSAEVPAHLQGKDLAGSECAARPPLPAWWLAVRGKAHQAASFSQTLCRLILYLNPIGWVHSWPPRSQAAPCRATPRWHSCSHAGSARAPLLLQTLALTPWAWARTRPP
jgi:hypothetical protein